jgi:hypothetical protein
MSQPADTFKETIVGPPGDLPRIRDADQGRPYKVVWMPSVNPNGGPPLAGGPVGTAFNCLLRVDLTTGRVEITTQNHGFVVDVDSIPGVAKSTHLHLNDGSSEGLEAPDAQAFSVQYHPEAAAGPHDALYLFDRFRRMMDR